MRHAWITWAGLALVAGAAAVLSFDALRTLAERVGTPATLAPLLPVTVDAAALVATRVWLAAGAPDRARRFARGLALSMIGLSVVGNGASHWLVSAHQVPPWWGVVLVASVPPAVLGATAHLAALAAAPEKGVTPGEAPGEGADGPIASAESAEAMAEKRARWAAMIDAAEPDGVPGGARPPVDEADEGTDSARTPGEDLVTRARRLVAVEGRMGRTRLARELGVTEHQARQVLARLGDEDRPVRLVAKAAR